MLLDGSLDKNLNIFTESVFFCHQLTHLSNTGTFSLLVHKTVKSHQVVWGCLVPTFAWGKPSPTYQQTLTTMYISLCDISNIITNFEEGARAEKSFYLVITSQIMLKVFSQFVFFQKFACRAETFLKKVVFERNNLLSKMVDFNCFWKSTPSLGNP